VSGELVRSDLRDLLMQIAAGRRGEISVRNLGTWVRNADKIVSGRKIEIESATGHHAPKFILRKTAKDADRLKLVSG